MSFSFQKSLEFTYLKAVLNKMIGNTRWCGAPPGNLQFSRAWFRWWMTRSFLSSYKFELACVSISQQRVTYWVMSEALSYFTPYITPKPLSTPGTQLSLEIHPTPNPWVQMALFGNGLYLGLHKLASQNRTTTTGLNRYLKGGYHFAKLIQLCTCSHESGGVCENKPKSSTAWTVLD